LRGSKSSSARIWEVAGREWSVHESGTRNYDVTDAMGALTGTADASDYWVKHP
jgi:hypothetical protein